MSFQVLPQAQPQQPVQVYPTTTVTNQQPPPHHYSNGSFGTVFIVLAVILVISLVACFLGRFCSRRGHSESHGGGGHGHKPFKQQNISHNQNQNHHFQPKEGGDIELGLDKRIPTTKPNGPGHGPGYGGQGSRPLVYGGGGGGGANIGVGSGEEKGFEMKNGGEGSMREPQGHGPRHGLGYGGRGPRPIVYGGGRGNGGGEHKGYEMKNGGERSMREQGHNGHDAPYKFTL